VAAWAPPGWCRRRLGEELAARTGGGRRPLLPECLVWKQGFGFWLPALFSLVHHFGYECICVCLWYVWTQPPGTEVWLVGRRKLRKPKKFAHQPQGRSNPSTAGELGWHWQGKNTKRVKRLKCLLQMSVFLQNNCFPTSKFHSHHRGCLLS